MPPPPKKPRFLPLTAHLPLSHFRADCPDNIFHHAPVDASLRRNLAHCDLGYCLVCDVRVAECVAWGTHCMGYFTHPEWRALRYSKKTAVPQHLLPDKVKSHGQKKFIGGSVTANRDEYEIVDCDAIEEDVRQDVIDVDTVVDIDDAFDIAADTQEATNHQSSHISIRDNIFSNNHDFRNATFALMNATASGNKAGPRIHRETNSSSSHERAVSAYTPVSNDTPYPNTVGSSKRVLITEDMQKTEIVPKTRDTTALSAELSHTVRGTDENQDAIENEIQPQTQPLSHEDQFSEQIPSIDESGDATNDLSPETHRLKMSLGQPVSCPPAEERANSSTENCLTIPLKVRLRPSEVASPLLEKLRRCWDAEKVVPAWHITKKREKPAPDTAGIQFPQRILIGCIDMWRPYCSHMQARSIDLPIGCHKGDVASVSSKSDIRIPGMSHKISEVLAREMGLDLKRPAVFDSCNCFETTEPGWPDMDGFYGRSSYWFGDVSPMGDKIPRALLACIDANAIEVRWELSHHTRARNNEKAFAMEHDCFRSLSSSTRKKVAQGQFRSLTQCEERMEGLKEFNASNCCLLTCSVYLTGNSFTSNMVTAGNFCPVDSAYGMFILIDGKMSLARELTRVGMQEEDFGSSAEEQDQNRASLMPNDELVKLEAKYDSLELSTDEGRRNSDLAVVVSALRWHSREHILPLYTRNTSQEFASVPEATIADGTSLWESLCYTHHFKKDNSLLTRAEDLCQELRLMSNGNEANADKASIEAILSSHTFTVSHGYHSKAEQPRQITVSLRMYQRESLAWMMDQEKKRSISDPFWVKIRGFGKNQDMVDVYYCPMTGSLSRFAPPPVVGGVLAEEMGLGKTIIAAALITSTLDEARKVYWEPRVCRKHLQQCHGTLIVCPTSILRQWRSELRKNVFPNLNVLTWYGPKRFFDVKKIASFDVVLTTYGIFSGGSHRPLLSIHWYRVIIDESTYLKGGSNTCNTELMNLVSSRRWALSGTPFGDNFKSKFLPTLRFIGVSPFAASKHFNRINLMFSSVLNNEDLPRSLAVPHFAYIMKNIMIRHVKSQELYGQPLVELPSSSGRCVSIVLEASEMAEYRKLKADAESRAWWYLLDQDNFGKYFMELAKLTRPLRVLADGVDPKTLKRASKKENVTEVKEEPASVIPMERPVGAKLKQLLRDVSSYRERDLTSKFVVFTEFDGVRKEVKRNLQNQGFGVLTLSGGMTAVQRGTLLRRFTEDPDECVLVLTLGSGACGLTLTMANVVVLFEVGLKRAVEMQAVDRIHRIGQTRPVETLTYVAKSTIDERIVEVRKKQGLPGVVGESPPQNGEKLTTLQVYRELLHWHE